MRPTSLTRRTTHRAGFRRLRTILFCAIAGIPVLLSAVSPADDQVQHEFATRARAHARSCQHKAQSPRQPQTNHANAGVPRLPALPSPLTFSAGVATAAAVHIPGVAGTAVIPSRAPPPHLSPLVRTSTLGRMSCSLASALLPRYCSSSCCSA
jgi:hypothetical protein